MKKILFSVFLFTTIMYAHGSELVLSLKNAIDRNDVEYIEKTLKEKHNEINFKELFLHDEKNNTLLMYAVRKSTSIDIKIIEEILKYNPNPDSQANDRLVTPLYIAAQNMNFPAMNLLLKHNSDIQLQNIAGASPYMMLLNNLIGLESNKEVIDSVLSMLIENKVPLKNGHFFSHLAITSNMEQYNKIIKLFELNKSFNPDIFNLTEDLKNIGIKKEAELREGLSIDDEVQKKIASLSDLTPLFSELGLMLKWNYDEDENGIDFGSYNGNDPLGLFDFVTFPYDIPLTKKIILYGENDKLKALKESGHGLNNYIPFSDKGGYHLLSRALTTESDTSGNTTRYNAFLGKYLYQLYILNMPDIILKDKLDLDKLKISSLFLSFAMQNNSLNTIITAKDFNLETEIKVTEDNIKYLERANEFEFAGLMKDFLRELFLLKNTQDGAMEVMKIAHRARINQQYDGCDQQGIRTNFNITKDVWAMIANKMIDQKFQGLKMKRKVHSASL